MHGNADIRPNSIIRQTFGTVFIKIASSTKLKNWLMIYIAIMQRQSSRVPPQVKFQGLRWRSEFPDTVPRQLVCILSVRIVIFPEFTAHSASDHTSTRDSKKKIHLESIWFQFWSARFLWSPADSPSAISLFSFAILNRGESALSHPNALKILITWAIANWKFGFWWGYWYRVVRNIAKMFKHGHSIVKTVDHSKYFEVKIVPALLDNYM